MADDVLISELRAHVLEIGRVSAVLTAHEQHRRDDHQEYRETYQEVRSEFRRLHAELGTISDAVTRTATDMELVAQQVRNSADDIRELKSDVDEIDKRVTSLETSRSRERVIWSGFVIVWTVLGAVGGAFITTVMPGWLPTWLKGAGQ
jgi:septal ring factor EnvC (AmiA/AmiB activator)